MIRKLSVSFCMNMITLSILGSLILIFSNVVYGYSVVLYPPDSINFPLFPGAVVEDFEDTTLIPGLVASVTGGGPPPGSDTNCTWDGVHCSSTQFIDGDFAFTIPNIRRFGIGIADNDYWGCELVTVNDSFTFSPSDYPNYDSSGIWQTYYLSIVADPGDPDISSVSFSGCTLFFDHLELDRRDAAMQNPDNGHWYQLVEVHPGLNWYEAKDSAEAMRHGGMQGHLATLTSSEEEGFVVGNFPQIVPNYVWLGATDEAVEGDWKWITSEPWSYTNWDPGEPNGGTSENCLDYSDGVDKWNDENCGRTLNYYLVEYECPDTSWVWLGDIPPTSVSVGWGEYMVDESWYQPGFDIAGIHYEHGIFTHAPGHVTYYLGECYSAFSACVGLDDGDGNCGDGVIFRVNADEIEIYKSDIIISAQPVTCFNLPLNGSTTLELFVDELGNYNCDESAWVNAKLITDRDGDGFPDEVDECTDSDLSPTVIIDGCDSGVVNQLFDDGCDLTPLNRSRLYERMSRAT